MTKTTVSLEEMGDLHRVEEASKAQELPKQEMVFSIAKRVRSRLSNLPDPTHPPLGFASGRGFERDYMIELEHDPAVKEWTKKHSIVIPYRFLGFPRRYHPDFLVIYKDGSRELHETKGIPSLFSLSTKLKRQSAEDYCETKGWRYKVVTRGLRWLS